MRALIVSDTHGQIRSVTDWMEAQAETFDEIWHLGDYDRDAEGFKALCHLPVYSVKGNCDLGSSGREHIILERMGKRIVLTHGHLERVKGGLTTLYVFARSQEADLICFGHTHQPVIFHEDGIYLFNPGSPTLPRLGMPRTVGIAEINEKGIHLSHFNL
ncbi:MAG: uncharacterized protein PWQ12_13 [Clostridiales bacterium]|jgi:hypothetical protein|nr:uncharacterized protein [Clostridiales bacterium]